MRLLKLSTIVAIILLGGLLAGCQASTTTPQKTSVASTPALTTPTGVPVQATPTITPVPSRSLVLCVQDEPQTLYAYGSNASSMWSVLEAVYDGPFDTRGYSTQAVIFEKGPQPGGWRRSYKASPGEGW